MNCLTPIIAGQGASGGGQSVSGGSSNEEVRMTIAERGAMANDPAGTGLNGKLQCPSSRETPKSKHQGIFQTSPTLKKVSVITRALAERIRGSPPPEEEEDDEVVGERIVVTDDQIIAAQVRRRNTIAVTFLLHRMAAAVPQT